MTVSSRVRLTVPVPLVWLATLAVVGAHAATPAQPSIRQSTRLTAHLPMQRKISGAPVLSGSVRLRGAASVGGPTGLRGVRGAGTAAIDGSTLRRKLPR